MLGIQQPTVGLEPVAKQQRDPLQGTRAVVDHTGRVVQRREQHSDDAHAGSLPTSSDDLPAHRRFQPRQAQPAGPGQVCAVTLYHDADRRGPGRGAKRLPRGLQGRGPDAFQQRPYLLDLAARFHEQLRAARAQMP